MRARSAQPLLFGALGVTQFAGYLQHDNKEETLRVYGETIMPALREHVVAKAEADRTDRTPEPTTR